MITLVLATAAALAYLVMAESDRGPLSDWSHRLYEDWGVVWFLLTMGAFLVLILGAGAIVATLLVGRAS